MPEEQLTVVVLNWKRPANVRRFVDQYLAHPDVGQVVVWDSNPGSELDLDPPDEFKHKLIYAGTDTDLGLYARFAMGALAAHDAVLFVDDDIELPGDTVSRLFRFWQADRVSVHGILGRRCPGGEYVPGRNDYGGVEVVLTRCCVASRRLCVLALAHGVRHMAELPGEPRGNGEDIVLSHAAIASSGCWNKCWKLPYRNEGYDDADAISVRNPRHAAYRNAVVAWGRREVLKGRLPAV